MGHMMMSSISANEAASKEQTTNPTTTKAERVIKSEQESSTKLRKRTAFDYIELCKSIFELIRQA